MVFLDLGFEFILQLFEQIANKLESFEVGLKTHNGYTHVTVSDILVTEKLIQIQYNLPQKGF